MKKLFSAIFVLYLSFSLFAQTNVEPTASQKQAVFMMNYAQYVTYKLKTYNNILALEEEYENLKDNMNFSTIEDANSVYTINNLIDSIYNERKNHKNRERAKVQLEKQMNQALQNSIPSVTTIVTGSLNPLSLALNTVRSAANIYVSYEQYKNQLSDQFDQKMFELQTLSEDILNSLYQDLNLYSYDLVKKYKISDEWRLNETELEKIFDFIKDSDKNRAFKNLKNMSEGRFVQHFPMYWYHLAKLADETGNKADALKYYNRFEKENIEIFRYDRIAVDAYKGKIVILLENESKNKNEILQKLKFIETNKTSWQDYYFCALVYAKLKDNKNATRLLERNILELESSVENQFIEAKDIISAFDSLSFVVPNEVASLEINRNALVNLGTNKNIKQNIDDCLKSSSIALNETLYLFGKNPASSVVNASKNELKQVKLSYKVPSRNICVVSVTLPIRWMISSSTMLKVVFTNGDKKSKPIEAILKLDAKASKKIKKNSNQFEECILQYTSDNVKFDWKKERCQIQKIILDHPSYPVEFIYDTNLNFPKQNQEPIKVKYLGKEYDVK